SGNGSVAVVVTPVWPNAGTLAAEAAFTLTAVAAIAAAPRNRLRRSTPAGAVSTRGLECNGFVMISSRIFLLGGNHSRQFGIMRAGFDRATGSGREGAGRARSEAWPFWLHLEGRKIGHASWVRNVKINSQHNEIKRLNRIPVENIRRTIELVERRFQRRHAMLGDALRSPAFAAVDRAQGARLAHQEYLVHPHGKDLPRHVFRGVAEKEGHYRRDFLRAHLLNFGDARLLRLGLGRDRTDQAAPGERRHAVRAHIEAVHVERDRFRQADDAEFGSGVIGLAE